MKMPQEPLEYFLKSLKLWGKQISGPVLALLAIVTTLAAQYVSDSTDVGRISKYSAWLTGLLAIALMFAAQYHAWRAEHDGRIKAEEELHAKADIQGTIWVKSTDVNVDSAGRPASTIAFDCHCSNHGKTRCEISEAIVTVSLPPGIRHPAFGPTFRLRHQIDLPSVKTLEPGQQFRYQSNVFVDGFGAANLRQSTITVQLVDSLGVEYTNILTQMNRTE